MKDTDIAWIAGILEGEACFDWNNFYTRGMKYPRIRIQMTDEDVIQKLSNLLGGNVYKDVPKNEKHSPAYRLAWYSRDIVEFITRNIYPYMSKRRKAVLDKYIEIFDKKP